MQHLVLQPWLRLRGISVRDSRRTAHRITGLPWGSFEKRDSFMHHRVGIPFLFLVILSISCLATTWNNISYLDNCLRVVSFQVFSFQITCLLNISNRMTSTQSKVSATFQDHEAKAILIMLDVIFMTHYHKRSSWAGNFSEIKALKTSGEYHGLCSLRAVAKIC